MADTLGFRQTYKQTGKQSVGGTEGIKAVETGTSGSKRSSNAVLDGNKLTKGSKIGPGKNLKDIGSGNFY